MSKKIGVFDSGVGGLSILQALRALPVQEFVYCADTAHLPYGEKSPEQIKHLTQRAVAFLYAHNIDALVIACHTASANAYDAVQTTYPTLPIIDVLTPVVHAATRNATHSTIGIIGTQATIASKLHEKKIHIKLPHARVINQACPLLVPLIEKGHTNTPELQNALGTYLNPLIKADIDSLIIGCTHYELIKPLIQEIVGPRVSLLSAATHTPAYVQPLLESTYVGIPKISYFASGDPLAFAQAAHTLLNLNITVSRW